MIPRLLFVTSHDQAERWSAYGFDIFAASLRYSDFLNAWRGIENDDEARAYALTFFAGEKSAAIQAGVPEVDPDIWRIDAAPKNLMRS